MRCVVTDMMTRETEKENGAISQATRVQITARVTTYTPLLPGTALGRKQIRHNSITISHKPCWEPSRLLFHSVIVSQPRFERVCWFRRGPGLPPSLWLSVSYKCEACCRVKRQTGNQSNHHGWGSEESESCSHEKISDRALRTIQSVSVRCSQYNRGTAPQWLRHLQHAAGFTP